MEGSRGGRRTGLERWFPGTRLVDDPAWDPELPRECDWVPGCYYLLRKSVVDQVGLFDRRYFEEMLALEGDVGARHLIGQHDDQVAELVIEDAGAFTDVDTPEAYDRLLTATAP